jgi:3-hydroxyacyl-CoA dehydrogenase/3a,7a,12a-trihydroxy-5b-cholest-24-enoyl-CoA hydratase
LLASRGAKIVVNDLGGGMDGTGASSRAADVVVEEIKAMGGEAVPDYNNVVEGAKLVETAIKAYGRIDIIVNNAGILRDVSFVKMTEEQWKVSALFVYCLPPIVVS